MVPFRSSTTGRVMSPLHGQCDRKRSGPHQLLDRLEILAVSPARQTVRSLHQPPDAFQPATRDALTCRERSDDLGLQRRTLHARSDLRRAVRFAVGHVGQGQRVNVHQSASASAGVPALTHGVPAWQRPDTRDQTAHRRRSHSDTSWPTAHRRTRARSDTRSRPDPATRMPALTHSRDRSATARSPALTHSRGGAVTGLRHRAGHDGNDERGGHDQQPPTPRRSAYPSAKR